MVFPRGRTLVYGTPALLLTLLALVVANNNYRLVAPSRAQLLNRIERSLENARTWILAEDMEPIQVQKQRLAELTNNPALLHMLMECARLAGDEKLRRLALTHFRNTARPNIWGRLIDPTVPFDVPAAEYVNKLRPYQRSFLWAMGPQQISLPEEEKAELYSPTALGRGQLTHQVMAWLYYRQLQGATAETDKLIRRLCERIAGEAFWDFRVTDQYLQRVLVLLASGHPDLVRPRWVERVLDAQQEDGGWTYTWYGWEARAYVFQLPEQRSSPHATAQGLWILHLLKYRYPAWIQANSR